MLFDAPAKAYVLGIKSHNSKRPCTKCYVVGRSVIRRGYASKAKNRNQGMKALSFLNFNAQKKVSTDLKIQKEDVHIPYCDVDAGYTHGEFIDIHEHELKEISDSADDSDYNSEDGTSSDEEEEPRPPLHPRTLTAKEIKKEEKKISVVISQF